MEVFGDGDALADVRARAAELGICDRVYFSGRVLPHREVLERVRSADAGVICNIPSKLNTGTLPTKLLEYAVLGVPIVTAELSAIREYFSPQEALFFTAGDPAALAAALRELAADPGAAANRVSAARRLYEEKFRWGVSAARYVALLDRLGPAA